MNDGYIFISNSTKPTKEKYFNRDFIELSNVSRPPLEAALKLGYDVYFGTNRYKPEELDTELPIKMYDSHTYRSILNIKDNFIALKNLLKITRNSNIKMIHCNTPVGGLIGRIGGKISNIDKVIYTVHGFHFFKGGSLVKNIIFYQAESVLARWTDVIITMNEEDYKAAKKMKLKRNGKVYFVHGVGVNTKEFLEYKSKADLKTKILNIPNESILCISVGDLTKGKNYSSAIKAISNLKNKNVHLIICGDGPELDNLKTLSKNLNINNQIHFLGYRNDIKSLLAMADIFLFTTLREGMPRALMEAMSTGIPCIASDIRGNRDLLIDGKGGYLINPYDTEEIAIKIENLINDSLTCINMGLFNKEVIKDYDVEVVRNEIWKIYNQIVKEENK